MDIIFKVLKYLKKYSNLIAIVVIICLVITCFIQNSKIDNYKSSYQEEVKSGSTMAKELDSIKNEKNLLETQISEYEQNISDKDTQIQQLQKDVQELEDTAAKLASAQKGTFKADGNYDQAREVWNALRDLGLNEYVCAGIIGNIMAEVGGQTLDISRWPIYSQGTYYGICQWAGSRKQRLLNDFGTTLNDQIRFLSVELFEVIPKDNSFYNMQDEKEAALYFAKKYERCNSKYYTVRQKNATKALEYFTK
jgi:uncharacterized protein YoxC